MIKISPFLFLGLHRFYMELLAGEGWCKACDNHSIRVPQKFKNRMAIQCKISLLNTSPEEQKAGSQRKNRKVRATQVSVSAGMDKENVTYPYCGKLFSLEKEWISDTCCAGCYVRWSKLDTKGRMLYDST